MHPTPTMAQDRPEFEVPPTRPSTPNLDHRVERIAEAPSRAEPDLPSVETSSPIRAQGPTTMAEPVEELERVTISGNPDDAAQESEQNGHDVSTVRIQFHFTEIDLFFLCLNLVVFPLFVLLDRVPPPLLPRNSPGTTFASCTKDFHHIPLSLFFCSHVIDSRYL
jgi:hypothetical protein